MAVMMVVLKDESKVALKVVGRVGWRADRMAERMVVQSVADLV